MSVTTPAIPSSGRSIVRMNARRFFGPIVVPQGFETDLASVPRQVWHRFPRWGPWSGAAIVHDWLYRTKPNGVDRIQADRVFRDLMREDRVTWGDQRMIYRAVRDFGDGAWRGHQEIEAA